MATIQTTWQQPLPAMPAHATGQQPLPGAPRAHEEPAKHADAPKPGPSKFADGSPLAPGELQNITDTDPPALHPATVIGDGFVHVDEKKLHEHDAKLKAIHEHHDNRSKPAHA